MATRTRRTLPHGRILIMDSDQEAVKLLMHDLGKEGYRVEIAEYTNRCFEKIKNEQIDVLILAVEAWGVKGCELIPIIKKINSLIPIIATSADDSMEVAARVREQGVFFYAIKPLDMEEIKLAVKNALNRKFSHRHALLYKEAEKQKDFNDEILDLAEAGKILKLSKNMVGKLAKKGEIPAVRIGNKWHFIRNQLLEWLRIMAAGNQKNYGTLILETIDEGVAVVDKRLKVVGCNSTYLQALDVPRDRIIGEYCYRVSHRSNVPCDEPTCPVRKAFKTKRPVKSMHINYDSEGHERYCDIIALPMKDEQGKVNQVLEVIRDNTEIYNLNKHLSLIMCFFARESKKTLGPVVMNISALIDEQLSKTISGKKHNEMLLVCLCNLKLMQDMIRNYIISYKGEKGELHCNRQTTDLHETIIKPVIKEFQPILLKTEMNVDIGVNKQQPVYCDPDLMKIVFSNLIHNATKYGARNTTIHCSLNIKDKDFELTVFNKGSGIPRDKLVSIFEPFTRFSRDGIRGTGLGLHVVKMIAEMHNGILKAESGYVIGGRPVAYDEFYADANLCTMKKKDLEKFARFILTVPTCEEVQIMEV